MKTFRSLNKASLDAGCRQTSMEQREIARNATESMAGPYGLPKFPVEKNRIGD